MPRRSASPSHLSASASRRPGGAIVRAAVLVVALAAAALPVTTSAGAAGATRDPGAREASLRVAAAFFPLAAVARSVGGPRVRVDDLTPPGVDAHDVEPTTDQVDALLDADLAVVLGGSFQPAIERVAERRDGPTLVWQDLLDGAAARRVDEDPHLWLDPVRYADFVLRIGERLAHLDPDHGAGYRRRAARFAAELRDFDTATASALTGCTRDVIVTSHEAFGWFTERYDLREVGVTRGSPDAEADPKRIAELADRARRDGTTTVFTEPLVSDRVARTLAREAGGLRTVVLDPLEGLRGRRGEVGDGDEVLRVMRRNVERVAAALDCP